MRMTRWSAIALAFAIAFTGLPAMTAHADAHEDEWPMAVQTYTYRNFTLFETIDMVSDLGLKYIEAYGGQQLGGGLDGSFGHGIGEAERTALKAKLYDAGVRLIAYGVVGLSPDEDSTRAIFEFADDMGIEIITANPDPDSFDLLEELVEEYGIKVAIHNHGPGARYAVVQDTLEAVEGRHAYIGACVDSGHVIRVEEAPNDVIRALGDRVHSLHLKDWEFGGPETIVGEGDMDLVDSAAALHEVGFTGPIMIEYELDADDPTDGVAEGVANWRAAVQEALNN